MPYPSGYGNGYVLIPKEHPLHGVEYSEEPFNFVDVHGGLTFSKLITKDFFENLQPKIKDLFIKKDIGKWMIGFDTCHYGNSLINCSKEMVEKEIENLKKQIENYDNKS